MTYFMEKSGRAGVIPARPKTSIRAIFIKKL